MAVFFPPFHALWLVSKNDLDKIITKYTWHVQEKVHAFVSSLHLYPGGLEVTKMQLTGLQFPYQCLSRILKCYNSSNQKGFTTIPLYLSLSFPSIPNFPFR